jgi:hypothetical protein
MAPLHNTRDHLFTQIPNMPFQACRDRMMDLLESSRSRTVFPHCRSDCIQPEGLARDQIQQHSLTLQDHAPDIRILRRREVHHSAPIWFMVSVVREDWCRGVEAFFLHERQQGGRRPVPGRPAPHTESLRRLLKPHTNPLQAVFTAP